MKEQLKEKYEKIFTEKLNQPITEMNIRTMKEQVKSIINDELPWHDIDIRSESPESLTVKIKAANKGFGVSIETPEVMGSYHISIFDLSTGSGLDAKPVWSTGRSEDPEDAFMKLRTSLRDVIENKVNEIN